VKRMVLAITLGYLVPASVLAGPVSGVVRTNTRSGVPPAIAVVYAEALDAARGPRASRVALQQRHKAFWPRVLGVPVGSTVAFPNSDTIFHNVFSLSGPEPFDLGLYRAGQSKSHTFRRSGTYRVFCNIHPEMTALIVVVPTPYVTTSGTDGRYVLDLPPGRYRVTALSERAEPVSVELTSVAGASVAPELHLDESAWVAVQHKNKYGLDYPKEAYKR
jgi:plastocyanin